MNTYRLLNPRALPDLTALSYDALSVPRPLRSLSDVGFFVVVVLAAVGLVVAVRRQRVGPLWLWLIPVLLALIYALLNGEARYRTTIDPFFIFLAGLALAFRRDHG